MDFIWVEVSGLALRITFSKARIDYLILDFLSIIIIKVKTIISIESIKFSDFIINKRKLKKLWVI